MQVAFCFLAWQFAHFYGKLDQNRIPSTWRAHPNGLSMCLRFSIISGYFCYTKPYIGKEYFLWNYNKIHTSAITSDKLGLQSNNQRLGVIPLVLFWNLSGYSSKKSLKLQGKSKDSILTCFIVLMFQRTLKKCFLHVSLNNLRVNGSYTINSMWANNGQESHVDFLFFILLHKGHSSHFFKISGPFLLNFL